ncbi:MAG: nucleotide exchange factor GrpE [bacterium]
MLDKKDVKKLDKRIKALEDEAKDYLAGWQRAKADYLNLQKRIEKDQADFKNYATEEILLSLLPIIDNFTAAFKTKQVKDDSWREGIKHIKNQLEKFLADHDVIEIATKGKTFDPTIHEAVEHIKNKKFVTGQIVEEVRKGYKLHDKVLRASQVKVAK